MWENTSFHLQVFGVCSLGCPADVTSTVCWWSNSLQHILVLVSPPLWCTDAAYGELQESDEHTPTPYMNLQRLNSKGVWSGKCWGSWNRYHTLNSVARKQCVQIGMNLSIEMCPCAIWLNNQGIIDFIAVALGNSSVRSIWYRTIRLLVSVRSKVHYTTQEPLAQKAVNFVGFESYYSILSYWYLSDFSVMESALSHMHSFTGTNTQFYYKFSLII
jgi:hypothetical protein